MSDQVCFKPRPFEAAFLQSGIAYGAFTSGLRLAWHLSRNPNIHVGVDNLLTKAGLYLAKEAHKVKVCGSIVIYITRQISITI